MKDPTGPSPERQDEGPLEASEVVDAEVVLKLIDSLAEAGKRAQEMLGECAGAGSAPD